MILSNPPGLGPVAPVRPCSDGSVAAARAAGCSTTSLQLDDVTVDEHPTCADADRRARRARPCDEQGTSRRQGSRDRCAPRRLALEGVAPQVPIRAAGTASQASAPESARAGAVSRSWRA
jgi:hypothetical protein